MLVIGDESWGEVAWGDTVTAVGRLQPADGHDLAAVLSAVGDPEIEPGRSSVLSGADAVRASVRAATRDGPGHSDALVPALVTGDDERLPTEVTDDFRTAGLTHLTAVSGTNLTLVLASVLLLARWAGVRARGLLVVGALCVVGFVLVARPEPSVLRAAVMGSVALVGLGSGGRAAGLRALGAAVVVLLALTPADGAVARVRAVGVRHRRDPGRGAGGPRRPGVLAAAVAGGGDRRAVGGADGVHAAGGRAVGTGVAGRRRGQPAGGARRSDRRPCSASAAGSSGCVVPPLGRLVGWLGACSAWVILAVAERSARLPGAEMAWPTGSAAMVVLVVLSLVGLVGASWVMRHRWLTVAAAVLLLVAVVRPGAVARAGRPRAGCW